MTTPSRQSLDGTKIVLQQLSKIAPPSGREQLRDPTVIISFVLSELVGSDLMRDVAVDLLENYPDGEPDVDLPRLRIEYTTFGQEFLYLPSVSGAVERLSGSNMCKVRREIAREMGQRASGSAVATVPHIETIRNSLSSLAGRLEYAESGEGNQFLRTAPLRVLAQQFTEIVPVAVVMGSKGAGKTYTYLQIVRSRVWSEFARQASALGVSSDWGLISPLLHSRNLKQSANSAVVTCRQTASEALDMKPSLASTAVADLINESLRHSFDETSWRQRWFTNFAQALDSGPADLRIRLSDFLQHVTLLHRLRIQGDFKGAGAPLAIISRTLRPSFSD